MASKGENKTEKRFTSAKIRKQKIKEGKWAIRSIAGPFSRTESVPVGFFLRDLLGVVRTLKEAKIALNNNRVSVNGKIRKDYRFPIGFFDLVSIEGMEKDYRLVFDRKGRLEFKEIDKKGKKSKICRIENKKAAKKNLLQIVTNDGRSIYLKEGEFTVGDSIEIELPSQKIIKTLKMEKGANAYIVGGKHAGEEGTVQDIKTGSLESTKLVGIKSGSKEFQTTAKNVFIVGEDK